MDYKEYITYIKENRKRLAGYLVVFVVMFALSAFASFNLLIDKFTLEMPELVGRDLREVHDMLEEMALTVEVTGEEFDREIEAGYVLTQSIEPGKVVRGQSVVEVTLSKGSEVRLIPSVIGMGFEKAMEMLREQELAIERVIRVHSRSYEGTVLAQRPEPDEWTGQAMTLLVSAGRRDVIYYNPYFLGMAKMDALMLARDLGLSVRISELDNSSVISYQSPSPGTEIKRGEVLSLRVGG
jgi:serine/threonine-protein kinase